MANIAKLIHAGVETEYAELYTGVAMAPGALDAAVTGDTVVLLSSVTMSATGALGQRSCIYIYDKGITLDLGGHTLTFTATRDAQKATGIEFKNTGSGTLSSVITNGTIKTENGCCGVYVDAGSSINMSLLTIDQNGTGAQDFYRYSAIQLASGTDAKVTIDSGVYAAENIAVYADQNTSLEINGGSFYSKNHNAMAASVADGTNAQGYKAVLADVGTDVKINGGSFGTGYEYDIGLSTLNGATITSGNFKGATLSANANDVITGGDFADTILYGTSAGNLNKYDITGGTFNEDVSAFVTNPDYVVLKLGKRYQVILNPSQPGDEYKFMNGVDLLVLWNLIKARFTMSDGDAITLTSENGINVNVNEDAGIKVDGSNSLAVKVDDITVKFTSEGKLQAQGTLPGEAIEFVESEGLQIINAKYDNVTIVLNSENELVAQAINAGAANEIIPDSEHEGQSKINVLVDDETIEINSENELYVPIDYKSIVIDSEGHISVQVDKDTIQLGSEGLKSPRPFINSEELIGDTNYNTEDIRITWFGTQEEYDKLESEGKLYDYTIYCIDTSEGMVIPSTPDYIELDNKPQINGVTLQGNVKLSELGAQPVVAGGTAIEISNNEINIKYHAGVLAVNTSNELVANTYTVDQIDNLVGSGRTIKVVAQKPEEPAPNTIYYVSTGTPSLYNVYLYDSTLTEIPLGTSQVGTYSAGKAIDIDNMNNISVITNTAVDSESTDDAVPTAKAVYSFLMEGASTAADGKRGLVPEPKAGDDTCVLRGDGKWAEIVDNLTTNNPKLVLSANQGKVIYDRLGDDVDMTEATLSQYVQSGKVYYQKRLNTVTLIFDEVLLKNPLDLECATIPAAVCPAYRMVTPLVALNNRNAVAGVTVSTDGAIKLNSTTGQYAYSGTLTYVI